MTRNAAFNLGNSIKKNRCKSRVVIVGGLEKTLFNNDSNRIVKHSKFTMTALMHSVTKQGVCYMCG